MKPPTLAQTLLIAALLAGASGLVRGSASQAKGAMEADLSNTKQLAVATLIYGADADDRFPLAYAPTAQGGYRNGAPFLRHGGAYDPNPNWAEVIYPYCKSAAMYAAVGAPRAAVAGEPDPKLPGVGHGYNGLMNAFLAENVATPSATVLFTESYGWANLEGWAVANPEMTCVANRPCEYRPAARGCGGTEPGTTSRLVAGEASQFGTDPKGEPGTEGARFQVASFTDGHAKAMRFDLAPRSDPYPADGFFWSRLDGEGRAGSYWADAFGCHPLRFRPDYEPGSEASPVERARS